MWWYLVNVFGLWKYTNAHIENNFVQQRTTTAKHHRITLDSGQGWAEDRGIMASFFPVTQTSLRKREPPSELKRRRTHDFYLNEIASQFKALIAIKLMLVQWFWTYQRKKLNNCIRSMIINNRKQQGQGTQEPRIKYLIVLLDRLSLFHSCH